MRTSLLLSALLALAACGDEPAAPPTPPPAAVETPADRRASVAGVVAETPSLSALARIVEAGGLGDTLRDPDQAYTLFAPSDAAFAALGDGTVDALLADPEAARTFVEAHLLSTRMLSADVFDGIAIETLGGTEIDLSPTADGLTVGGAGGTTAAVVQPDLDAPNGVVHVIDAVLTRPAR